MKKMILLAFALCCFSGVLMAQNGKLDRAKESLGSNSGSSSSDGGSSSSDSDHSDNDDSEGILDEFALEVGYFFLKVGLYTTYGVVAETPWELERPMHSADLTPYPYFKKEQGEYTVTEGDTIRRVRFEASYNYIRESSRFYGHRTQFDVRFAKRFGAELSYINFTEDAPDLNKDHLSIISLTANYYRVRTEHVSLWWGIGATYVGSGVNTTGFTYGLGIKYFPIQPVSLEAGFKSSFINEETLNHAKLLLKYHHKNYWLSGGYEHYKLGDPTASMFSIGVGVSF